MHLMVHTRANEERVIKVAQYTSDQFNIKELEDFSIILGGTLKKYERLSLTLPELWILDAMRNLKKQIDDYLKIVKP